MSTRILVVLFALLLAACGQQASTPAEIAMPGGSTAMAPRLSNLPDGRLLLSWIARDEQQSLRYAIHDGKQWGEAVEVVSGHDWFSNWADTAGVTALDNGLLVAHWLQKNGESTYAYEVRYSVSADQGKSWSEPRRAHDDDSASEHGFVSVLPRDGGFEMFWLDGRKTLEEGGGMTLRMGRFAADGERLLEAEVDGLTCDCCPTDAARLGGNSMLVYRDRDSEERRDIFMAVIDAEANIDRHEVNDDAWVMPACPVNGPAIVASEDSVSVFWFTAADDKRELRFAQGDAAGEFTRPRVVASGDPHGRVDLMQTADGLLGLWLAGQGDAGRLELQLLDRPEAQRHVIDGLSVARGVGYPRLGQLPGGDVLVVWTGIGAEAGLVGRRLDP